MNMIRVIEFLPILNALAEGKTIQYLSLGGEWKDVKINYISDFTEDDKPEYYRIKPESQLVPFSFEDAEFLIGRAVKANNNYKIAGLILSVSDVGVHIHPNTQTTYFQFLLKNYTFLDGSPCGKLVETSSK